MGRQSHNSVGGLPGGAPSTPWHGVEVMAMNFRKYRTIFVLALTALVLAVSAGCVQGPIPDESTQVPSWYRTPFKEWGLEYNQHRDDNFRWNGFARIIE